MDSKKKGVNSIDEYIAGFPEDVQKLLQEVRRTIRAAAPDAEERISYQMPAFYQNGILVWFGGHTRHIGFYPTGEGVEAFKDELSAYKLTKGAVQFPLDKPLPHALITKIVKYRLEKTRKQAGSKSSKKGK
jgi:uncharacterized protein YdhG (YjbR/CyaY superfamily)